MLAAHLRGQGLAAQARHLGRVFVDLRCRLTPEADNGWEPRHVSFVPRAEMSGLTQARPRPDIAPKHSVPPTQLIQINVR